MNLLYLLADLIDLQSSFDVLHPVRGFWVKSLQVEGCWSSDLTMTLRRLLSSWRFFGSIAGRINTTLVIRDSSTQQALFVCGFFCDGSAEWKQLRVDIPLRQALLPSKSGKLPSVISGKTSSFTSGMQVNRMRSSRNLRPAIRSKLRLRVRHRERVHFEGRWHSLWRSYAEEVDFKRMQHILTGQFSWCGNSFSALLEAQPAEPGCSAITLTSSSPTRGCWQTSSSVFLFF